jgi:protein-S-isoprenylcysteine O-methyltransferase Ste14
MGLSRHLRGRRRRDHRLSCATTPTWSPNACGLLSSASSAGTTRTCCSTRSASRWSQVPVALPVVRGLLVLGNFAVIARTARENAFLTPVVKAQADPGQRVISSGSGPYAVVRHPMYAGALLLVFGTPLLLGSLSGSRARPSSRSCSPCAAIFESGASPHAHRRACACSGRSPSSPGRPRDRQRGDGPARAQPAASPAGAAATQRLRRAPRRPRGRRGRPTRRRARAGTSPSACSRVGVAVERRASRRSAPPTRRATSRSRRCPCVPRSCICCSRCCWWRASS